MTSSSKRSAVPVRILLVDDNASGLKARALILEENGYHTVTTTSPKEALNLFTQESFDLVVTDYRMPLMNGTELIRELRSHCLDVPIILLSGVVEVLGLTEKSTGASAVISKSNKETDHLLLTTRRLVLRRKPPRRSETQAKMRNRVSSL